MFVVRVTYSDPSAGGLAGWGLALPKHLPPWTRQFDAQLDCGWGYQRLSDWFCFVSWIFTMKSALDFFSIGPWESRKESLVCSHLGKKKQESGWWQRP